MNITTLKKVSEETGVSISTVSRVVNNKTYVKEETRRKVLECLNKLNYRPDENARSLVNRNSNLIGLVLADIRSMHHVTAIYSIQNELEKLGYCCLIVSTGHEEEKKAYYMDVLSQRRVEAVVFIGSMFACESVKRDIEKYLSNIPVFITNGYLDLPNVYGIVSDEMGGVIECVRHLYLKGRKNICFINNFTTPSNSLKIDGYYLGIDKYLGRDGSEGYVFEVGDDVDSIKHSVTRIMTEHPEIDSIIACEDRVAMTAISALHEMGLSVPHDVSVIGINNSDYAKTCIPALTSLDNSWTEVNVATAKNLKAILKGEKVQKHTSIGVKLIPREST